MTKMDKRTFLMMVSNMEKLKILTFKQQREILEFLFNAEQSNPIFHEDEKLLLMRNLIDYTDPSEKEAAQNSYKRHFEEVKQMKEEAKQIK